METGNSLTASRGDGGGKCCRGGEGIIQRTCLSDPWTGAMVCGWAVGWRGRLQEGGEKGNIGTMIIEKN